MRITPLDIRKQEFRKTMRGLDTDEVYAFLNTVAEEYEAVLSDNKKLRERIVDLEERLKEYKNIEMNLRNTLLTAERVTSEAKENARKEASLIVRGAEVEADKAAQAIRAHTQQLRREVLELKRQKDNYLTRFRTLLESHHRVLNGFQEDFATVDREIEEIGKKVEEDLDKGTPSRRMSRQKITEEFGHAPKDKVTWDEERRREEEPRPSVPRPGSQPEASPEDPSFPQDEDMNEAPPVSKAQTSLLPEEEVDKPNQAYIDPIGKMGEGPGVGAPPPPESTGRASGEQGAPVGGEAGMERGSEEVRRSVARSIEQELYPEAGGRAVEDRAEIPPQAAEDTGPPEGDAPRQAGIKAEMKEDQWKQYEVRREKPDWKDYDIAGADPKQPPARKKKAVSRADDSEVEEALSGLKEVPDSAKEPKAQPAEKVMTLEDEIPDKGGSSPGQAHPPKKQAAKKPADGPKDQDEDEWSMEELRKNLSNFNRDERDQG
jgi:cell division initiation protein